MLTGPPPKFHGTRDIDHRAQRLYRPVGFDRRTNTGGKSAEDFGGDDGALWAAGRETHLALER